MKKKIIAVLEDIKDEIDVNASIHDSDVLVGKMIVIDAQELEAIKNNINDVIKMIQNEIDFDDALNGNDAVPVITGDRDTDALLEDERINQEQLNVPNECHIHSWEHGEYDDVCQLCTNDYVVGE